MARVVEPDGAVESDGPPATDSASRRSTRRKRTAWVRRRAPQQAQKARPIEPPRITGFAQTVIHLVGSFYLRLALGVRRVRAYNLSNLTDALSSHYRGDAQVLLLFRHVDMADGPVVMHTVANLARNAGAFSAVPHCYFLYGRDVLNWAGRLARWIFPRSGGIAVSNAQHDRFSIEAIRAVLRKADHPLAFAPEGQVTYRMNTVGPTTRGAGTFAWWCRQREPDTAARPVVIVPIGLGYLYPETEEHVLLETLQKIAVTTGTSAPAPAETAEKRSAWLIRQTIKLFGTIAQELVGDASIAVPEGYPDDKTLPRDVERARNGLCDALLRRGEAIMKLPGDGIILERLFRLRHVSLASIYRRDGDPAGFVHARAASADIAAGCGKQADRFQQIVDVLMYLTPEELITQPTLVNQREYALNLLDLVNRINAGTIESRRTPRGREAIVTIGPAFEAGSTGREGASRREFVTYVNRESVAALEAVTDAVRRIVLSGSAE